MSQEAVTAPADLSTHLAPSQVVDAMLRLDGRVLPVSGKRPATCYEHHECKKFLRGVRTATRDRDLILAALAHHPEHVVGFQPGRSLFVADIDSAEALKRMQDALGDDLLTRLPSVRTREDGTGWHVYVSVPTGRKWSRPTGWSKIDVRANLGGYVVAPGQMLDSGKSYLLAHGSLDQAPGTDQRLVDLFDVATAPARVSVAQKPLTPFDDQAWWHPSTGSATDRFIERITRLTGTRTPRSSADGSRDRSADLFAVWRCGQAESMSAEQMAEAVLTYLPPLVRSVALERGRVRLVEDAARALSTDHRSARTQAASHTLGSVDEAHRLIDDAGLRPGRTAQLHEAVNSIATFIRRLHKRPDAWGVVSVDLGVAQFAAMTGLSKTRAASALLALERLGVLVMTGFHRFYPDGKAMNRVRSWSLRGLGRTPRVHPSRRSNEGEVAASFEVLKTCVPLSPAPGSPATSVRPGIIEQARLDIIEAFKLDRQTPEQAPRLRRTTRKEVEEREQEAFSRPSRVQRRVREHEIVREAYRLLRSRGLRGQELAQEYAAVRSARKRAASKLDPCCEGIPESEMSAYEVAAHEVAALFGELG